MAAQTTALTGSDQAIGDSRTTYHGISVRETAGSTAVVRVRETGASGTLLDSVALAANASISLYYADGLIAQDGIYVDIVSGAVEGSVRHG